MSEQNSTSGPQVRDVPKDVRPVDLDDVDRRVLTILHSDARISNSALAEAVGHLPVRRALDRLLPFESPFTRVDPGEIPTEQAATTPASQESRPAPR